MICGEDFRFPLPATVGTDVVCESPDCRLIMSRRAHVGPHAFSLLIERCRWQRGERKRLAERSARITLENEAIRVEVTSREELPASDYPLVVLPAASQQIEEPSPDRRQKYREYLADIIAKAVAGGDDDAAPPRAELVPADEGPLAVQFCGLCRGVCCSMGREHAYLDVATIRRLMRLRPDLAPEQISAEYIDRILERTVTGSCINHTEAGCGLPREMRSDTCNAYYCKALCDWQERCTSDEISRGALVIQRGQDNLSRELGAVVGDVVGVSIVTESGVRSLAR